MVVWKETISKNDSNQLGRETYSKILYRGLKMYTLIDLRVEACLNDVVSRMHQNKLKLNTDKTELIVFSSKSQVDPILDWSFCNKICSIS